MHPFMDIYEPVPRTYTSGGVPSCLPCPSVWLWPAIARIELLTVSACLHVSDGRSSGGVLAVMKIFSQPAVSACGWCFEHRPWLDGTKRVTSSVSMIILCACRLYVDGSRQRLPASTFYHADSSGSSSVLVARLQYSYSNTCIFYNVGVCLMVTKLFMNNNRIHR